MCVLRLWAIGAPISLRADVLPLLIVATLLTGSFTAAGLFGHAGPFTIAQMQLAMTAPVPALQRKGAPAIAVNVGTISHRVQHFATRDVGLSAGKNLG
jgi:hypothetical protein